VLVINTLAPFVLNGQLRPLMEYDLQAWKFIVNVSVRLTAVDSICLWGEF
jgi:hypothetical protein